jgi:hypothetical protein
VDRIGSGSCPMAGFGICGVEPSGSATTMFISKTNHKLSGSMSAQNFKSDVFLVTNCFAYSTGRNMRPHWHSRFLLNRTTFT